MNIKGMISAIVILLTSTAVYSQTAIDTTKTKQLEEVIVTANKSEQKILRFQLLSLQFQQNRLLTHV